MPLRRPLPAKSRLEAAYPVGRHGTLCQHRAFSRTSIPGREASGDQGYARGGCKAWSGRFLRGVVLELPPRSRPECDGHLREGLSRLLYVEAPY